MKSTLNFEWWSCDEPKREIPPAIQEQLTRFGMADVSSKIADGYSEGELFSQIEGDYRGYWSLVTTTEESQPEDTMALSDINPDEIDSPFMSLCRRQNLLKRWPLVRSICGDDTVMAHSASVTQIALMMALIANKQGDSFDLVEVMTYALLHDAVECITADTCSPTKNSSPEMAAMFEQLESVAEEGLVNTLPASLQQEYSQFLSPSDDVRALVKAADEYDAMLKCIDECDAGNEKEFGLAMRRLQDSVFRRVEQYSYVETYHRTFGQAYKWGFDRLVAHSHI